MATRLVSGYDYPQYFDLVFRDETQREADFFEAAFARYAQRPVRELLEPACGGGRLVVEMARRGYRLTGLDISRPAVQYLRRRLRRSQLQAHVVEGDMTCFSLPGPVDAAFNTFNSFRHLVDETSARDHLRCVAEHLRPGGLFILGFHLLPLDADTECIERWRAQHAGVKVSATLRVLATDRGRRREDLRLSLLIRSRDRQSRIRHDFSFRMYTADQFRRTLAAVPALELCDVFDFWYEIDEPRAFDDELADALFVLRKREQP